MALLPYISPVHYTILLDCLGSSSAFLSDHFGIVRYEGGVAQGSKSLVIAPDGNVNIGTLDSAIPYPKLTVTGPDATVNVETAEILRVM